MLFSPMLVAHPAVLVGGIFLSVYLRGAPRRSLWAASGHALLLAVILLLARWGQL